MTYRFCADRAGSFWYHSHMDHQYSDGLYGAFIVTPYPGDTYASQYTHDIPILAADWYNGHPIDRVSWFLSPASFGVEPVPDAYIFNGFFTQQLSYALPRDAKVRFRFISSAAFGLFNISIDGYTMTVIEVDSTYTLPYEVNAFPLNVAQRVSVLVDFSSSNAWSSGRQAVYLRALASREMYDLDMIPKDLNDNLLATIYLCDQQDPRPECATVVQSGFVPIPPLPNLPALHKNYRAPMHSLDYSAPQYAVAPNPALDINMLDVRPLYKGYARQNAGNCYYKYYSDVDVPTHLLPFSLSFETDPFQINRGTFNGISLDIMQQYSNLYEAPIASPRPLLHDMIIPGSPYYAKTIRNMDRNWVTTPGQNLSERVEQIFDGLDADPASVKHISQVYSSTAPSGQDWNVLLGNSKGQYLLPGNVTVELLVVNTDGGSHPIHMHGYSFWVVASSDRPDMTGPYPLRDVFSLPPNGWIRFRIQTDNPGAWIMHCHITWHMDAGLGVVLVDNLPALQTDPAFAYSTLVPKDQVDACEAYNPVFTLPPIPQGTTLSYEEYKFVTPVPEATKKAMLANLLVTSLAFVGLILYKIHILDHLLAQFICMNIGTLVGAVFIEFLKELYEQIFLAHNLTFENTATIMCFGFLFPFSVEKFLKRGRTNKFRVLNGLGNNKQPPSPSTETEQSNQALFKTKQAGSSNASAQVPLSDPSDKAVKLAALPKESIASTSTSNGSSVDDEDRDVEAAEAVFHVQPSSSVAMLDSPVSVVDTLAEFRHDEDMVKIAAALAAEKTDWNLIAIILAGEALDVFVDGGIIAAAFLANSSAGWAAVAGVFMEELLHMTGSFAVFVAAGAPLWKCVLLNIFSASWLFLGSGFILVASTGNNVNPAKLLYLLAFACGTYLYVAMVDLTPLMTQMPWQGYKHALSLVFSISLGIGFQALIAVYHKKLGTS
eukprot:gb/GEZN01000884.1/.p1 GENE.gb/GEZN01000884.1/~~gb/GEZN01000884.1/.p1  ORF type:complete len:1083 (-),score=169.56 gb/GEZN01000884.1/:296-3124(-)